MALLEQWRDIAYGAGLDAGKQKKLWEEYFAKERHRAHEILLKISRMERVYDRRYQ